LSRRTNSAHGCFASHYS